MTDIARFMPRIPEDISDHIQELSDQAMQAKESILKQVALQVLGREPVTDDWKDFSFVRHAAYPGIEMIAYKGNMLGELKMEMDGLTGRYTFEPKTHFG